MTSVLQPCALDRFFIFNPLKFCLTEENDTEKVLYFHPSEIPLGKQMADVGLCEALTNFARTFSKHAPSSCETEKARFILQQPEPGWWTVMVVLNPRLVTVGKDGKEKEEWKGDLMSEPPLQALLSQLNAHFKMFYGGFEYLLEKHQEKKLRELLPKVWDDILLDCDPSKANIFTSLSGIKFLPVDKNVYLRIQSFINTLENSFEHVHYSVFMYSSFLIWSGLDQGDMHAIYNYATSSRSKLTKLNTEGFITGLTEENSRKEKSVGDVPIVFLGPKGERLYLVIYKSSECMCFFFVDDVAVNNTNFYVQLQRMVSTQLNFLAPIIQEHSKKIAALALDEFNYLYFNGMNLALKSTLNSDTLSPDLSRILNGMHTQFETNSTLNEVLVEVHGGGWVVGKKSDHREFYILFEQKGVNLLTINDEIKKLGDTYFKDIFID